MKRCKEYLMIYNINEIAHTHTHTHTQIPKKGIRTSKEEGYIKTLVIEKIGRRDWW